MKKFILFFLGVMLSAFVSAGDYNDKDVLHALLIWNENANAYSVHPSPEFDDIWETSWHPPGTRRFLMETDNYRFSRGDSVIATISDGARAGATIQVSILDDSDMNLLEVIVFGYDGVSRLPDISIVAVSK